METLEKSTVSKVNTDNQQKKNSNRLLASWNKQAVNFETSRFGWMAILIAIQSCLGAVACMFILKSNAPVVVLATCSMVAMGSNALFIALASPKLCLIGFYISVLINGLFILNYM